MIDFWNPQVCRVVEAIIGQEKPDVVHTHKLRGLSPSVWQAARRAGIQNLVHTCHDYELLSPEGTLTGFLGRRAAQGSLFLWPYQEPRRSWSRAVTTVTAPSKHTLEQHTSLNFFSQAGKAVIPNSHGFSAANLPWETSTGKEELAEGSWQEYSLLYLGRLETSKGIDLLCRAFAEIAPELPYLYLDVAGSGSREAALREQYASTPQIRFHGHVAGESKEALIARSLILVMPSIWQEVFGISIVEAYAYGKPVLATRIGGIPELVRDGETGFLVEPGNIEDWQRVIRRIVANPEEVNVMSSACREAARAYTLEAVASAYLHAYEAGFKSAAISAPVPCAQEG
jgi:glycosyltransferase involved in cell wall biosynthesis